MENRRFIATYFCLFLLLALSFTSCKKKEILKKPANDFISLMGKDLPAWKYVQTEEDFQNLEFFKKVYETNISALKKPSETLKIPKVIHFIWLGPKPFPRESIENVRNWIAHHPDWTIKFWTDRDRPLPHPRMKLCKVKDFPFQKLEPYFHSSENFGERSDILRYEILFQEGGVYVDHDVKCMKSFAPFHLAYDLYCGMEVPYPTTLSSSVLPTNNIVGSKPGHIVLSKSMDWLVLHWDQIEKDYPGKDRDSIINRVSHRTFLVLGETFKVFGNTQGNVDIAFPSYYFNSPKEEWALYSQHQYKGNWFENESEFEKMVRKRLMMLSKKTNKMLLALGVLAGLNVIGFAALCVVVRRKRVVQP